MLKPIAILAVSSLLSACVVLDDNDRHRGHGSPRPHVSPRVDDRRPPPGPPRHVGPRKDRGQGHQGHGHRR